MKPEQHMVLPYADVGEVTIARARRELPRLCAEFRELSKTIVDLERDKKALMVQIKEAAKGMKETRVRGETWTLVKIQPKPSEKLSIEGLLAHGVGLDVIDAATIETPRNFYFKIADPPAEELDDEEG